MPHITKETFLEALECRTRAWLNLRAGGGARGAEHLFQSLLNRYFECA